MTETNAEKTADWFDEIQIRQVREDDLPGLEWEGEFTHFRRLYAEAFRRAQRGMSILWLADLPGKIIVGQVFVQLHCDRPEMCNGSTGLTCMLFGSGKPTAARDWGSACWMWSKKIWSNEATAFSP